MAVQKSSFSTIERVGDRPIADQSDNGAEPKVIDTHAHVVLEAGFGVAGKYGPELREEGEGAPFFRIGEYKLKMSYTGSIFMDVDVRLEAMEKIGIDLQMLSPNPLTLFHHIPADDAIRYCKVTNDAVAEIVRDHPGKLLGSAGLPMQDIDAACEEVTRAVKDLGMVAAYVGTNYPFDLDDPRMDDFYRTIVELDVPLFMHPASTGGAGGPDDPRMGRFDMSIIFGYACEETIAASQLVLGGVLDRHPKLDVCISHGAGTMPYVWPRFEAMCKFRDWAPDSVKEHGFKAVLNRLWFDAHVEGEEAHDLMVKTYDRDRLVFGTNFGGWDTPSQADDFAASLTPNSKRLLRMT